MLSLQIFLASLLYILYFKLDLYLSQITKVNIFKYYFSSIKIYNIKVKQSPKNKNKDEENKYQLI